jgi:hypothetical protein
LKLIGIGLSFSQVVRDGLGELGGKGALGFLALLAASSGGWVKSAYGFGVIDYDST